MAILTIQIPDNEVSTLSTIVERIAGSIIKVNADEDIYTNDCLQKEDDLKNKLASSSPYNHFWND